MRKPLLLVLLPCLLALADAHAAPPETIERLDLERYQGQWFELAKYPNRFQKHCIADTSARYALRDDGRVQVINRCRTADGGFDTAIGEARRTGGEGSAALEVRFAPAWLSWLPMVWGEYRVIELDADYTLAAVSDSEREYLWILSRSAEVEPARLEALIARLVARGFDAARIERTRHNPD